MNDLSNAPSQAGHNNPPVYDLEAYQDFDQKSRDFADAAGQWKEAGKIADDATAEKANDFIEGARALFKQIEDTRKDEKAPHLTAGQKIDADFKKLKDRIERAVAWVKAPLEAFLTEKQRIEDEKRDEEERKAREAEEEAQRQAAAAESRNDIVGQEDAKAATEEAQARIKETEKPVKARVGSATGGAKKRSLRTVRSAVLTNISAAFMTFKDEPEVTELLIRLANARLRAAKGADINLPGFKITSERKL